MDEPPELSDHERLEAVRGTGLLGSPREAEFDQLTRLAARLLNAPAAFVTVISDDQQYIKSAETGADPDPTGESQPLEASFCKFAVASRQPLIVEDARQHELVRENRAIEAGVIAYAGVPLQTHEGEAIGALCVVDAKPRKWSDEEIDNLHVLARSAMKLIDQRTAALEQRDTDGEADAARDVLQCVAQHLRALDSYAALLAGSAEVDLDQEARRRGEVDRTYRGLVEKLGQSNEAPTSHHESASRLLKAGGAYIAASREREEAGIGFAEGRLALADLESSIRKQNDASDALRMVALHLGADI